MKNTLKCNINDNDNDDEKEGDRKEESDAFCRKTHERFPDICFSVRIKTRASEKKLGTRWTAIRHSENKRNYNAAISNGPDLNQLRIVKYGSVPNEEINEK